MALVLLAVLDATPDDLYGYEIAKRLQRANEGEALFKEGTIYPVLRALSASGFLRATSCPRTPVRLAATTASPTKAARCSLNGAASGARRATSSIASSKESNHEPVLTAFD